jgi:hypothetical protein
MTVVYTRGVKQRRQLLIHMTKLIHDRLQSPNLLRIILLDGRKPSLQFRDVIAFALSAATLVVADAGKVLCLAELDIAYLAGL